MNAHIEIERLHDLVDGLMTAAERVPVEAHLRACGDCRELAAELATLRAELGALPREAQAPEAIWRGVRDRIAGTAPGAPAESARVLAFPGTAAAARRLSFSVPQLAAAAAVVALLSAGSVWWVMGSGAGVGETPSRPTLATGEAVGAARAVSSGETSYQAATLELERILAEGRSLLAPETVATLEQSLATIDTAIAEVREALAQDPSSPLLARLLVNHQGTRLRVLRQAAALVGPRI